MTKLFILGLFLASVVFGLDQFSKDYMLRELARTDSGIITINSYFNLVLVWNNGISFGMFASHRQPALLIIISLVIIGILVKWLERNQSLMVAIGIGLVVGGAGGNIMDRMNFGAVVDFLDFHVGTLHWPAFNVADAGIFIGVVVLCVHSMFFEGKELHTGRSS